MVYGYIYLITNIKNNKQYVGLTTKSIEERFAEHCKADTSIGRAIKEGGVDNFIVEQLDVGYSQEGLCDLEVEWIDTLGTYENGYNDTLGGEGVVRSKLPINLTIKQKKYIEWLKEQYKKGFDINDENSMFEISALSSIAWYFLSEYKSMKSKFARLILSFPSNVVEFLLGLDLVDTRELLEYAER